MTTARTVRPFNPGSCRFAHAIGVLAAMLAGCVLPPDRQVELRDKADLALDAAHASPFDSGPSTGDVTLGDRDADDPFDASGPPTSPPTSPPTAAPTAPPTEPPAGDNEFCVSETNRYRTQVGRPPVRRSQALEAYAAEGAREDHEAQSPHGHILRTGGGGIAHAETTCLGSLGWFVQGSIQATVEYCLAAFFSEGPGGGNYEAMVGNFGSVGCGWYVDESDSITITQDFGQ